LFVFAGTVTFAGTGNAFKLLLVRVTVSPPAGAFPLITMVPVVICPETTFAGLKESVVTTGAFTVSIWAVAVPPLGSVGVMLTVALAATGNVMTLNVPLVALPGIVKFIGTVAAAALVVVLVRVTVKPAGGAGPLSMTVPIEPLPPVTELELNVNDIIAAGFTVSIALLLVTSVAVTVTAGFGAVATPTVVALKVCDDCPAAIAILAGTITTDGAELVKETVTPPAGAAWLSVTVPVELVPPVTVAGLKLTPDTVSDGSTVTFAITLVKLVVAVTVELPAVPAVTTKV